MSNTLDFTMQQQALSEWCWAAVSVSISDFYKDTSYGSQCGFVTSVTRLGDCCQSCQNDGETSVCNQPHNLGTALWQCGHAIKVRPDIPNFEQVKAELDAGRPVACTVYWNDGNVHALAITGYTDEGMLLIADPEKPGTVVSIGDDFVYSATYDGASKRGKITETFRTR